MARLDRIAARPRILLDGFGVTALLALVIATLPPIVAGSTSEPDSIEATAPSVKLLASKLYKVSATPAGTLTAALRVGKVSARVMCKDDGAGQIRVKVLFRSSVGGTVLLASNGSLC